MAKVLKFEFSVALHDEATQPATITAPVESAPRSEKTPDKRDLSKISKAELISELTRREHAGRAE